MINSYSYLNGVFYLSQLLLSNFLFTLALLVYVIVSLVDMWKSYTRTSSKTDFLFFILTLITLFVGFLLSPFPVTRFSVETKPDETNHRDFTHCRPFRSFSFKSLFMKTLFLTKRSVLLQTDRFFMFFLREKVYAIILFPASVLH